METQQYPTGFQHFSHKRIQNQMCNINNANFVVEVIESDRQFFKCELHVCIQVLLWVC